jgi:hypothetical protein
VSFVKVVTASEDSSKYIVSIIYFGQRVFGAKAPGAASIDISQYRLLFGFCLLYTDRVPFDLLDSAALLLSESCGGRGQIVFLNLTTII